MMQLISKTYCFGGWLERYSHKSMVNNCDMTFAVYLPPQAEAQKVPVLLWLSGLTCTDENFMQKAGAQRAAAELGVAIVAPDTSPRGEGVADDPQGAWDFGLGAGFYVNATQRPWDKHYQMYDYVTKELPDLINANFAVTDKWAISGHSMGGHGALTIALKNPQLFTSVSAFSPIVNPMSCPWGKKAFSHYLGEDQALWKQYDSCELVSACEADNLLPMLIDQGLADDFLEEQLKTDNLLAALNNKGLTATIRKQPEYDHSYFFIASFIEEHLQFHAEYLGL
jgi:S-formylglutathione hydrolase